MIEPVRVGVIGCGVISGIYFENMLKYKPLQVLACADLDVPRAKATAEKYGLPNGCAVDEMLADPDIELVVNLTVPVVHAAVNTQILKAGKHAYAEKPFATTREDAAATLTRAKEKCLLNLCAPDTYIAASMQTLRKVIDEGSIGVPLGLHSYMLGHGPEHWIPQPHAYYKKGTGPLLDMAPYYLNAMINVLGPIRRISGSARITTPQRIIPSGSRKDEVIEVDTPTHVVAVMDFASGPVVQLTCSSDVWASHLPHMEIYGSEGVLTVPDPNQYSGNIEIRRSGDSNWHTVPVTHKFGSNSRGVGVMDMAYAIRTGRPHRANGELAYHVTDTMLAILEASDQSRYVELESTAGRPAALSPDVEEFDLLA